MNKVFIDYFLNDQNKDFETGSKLNGNSPFPFIKKRLKGSGGYRVYFYLYKIKESIYLGFIHPKSGKHSIKNIGDDFKAQLIKNVSLDIARDNLYKLSVQKKGSKSTIFFSKKH